MCYEESFFRMWGRKDARRRAKVEGVIERTPPKQAEKPVPVPAPATSPRHKETEREPEVV
jgi:hypothetical protein